MITDRNRRFPEDVEKIRILLGLRLIQKYQSQVLDDGSLSKREFGAEASQQIHWIHRSYGTIHAAYPNFGRHLSWILSSETPAVEHIAEWTRIALVLPPDTFLRKDIPEYSVLKQLRPYYERHQETLERWNSLSSEDYRDLLWNLDSRFTRLLAEACLTAGEEIPGTWFRDQTGTERLIAAAEDLEVIDKKAGMELRKKFLGSAAPWDYASTKELLLSCGFLFPPCASIQGSDGQPPGLFQRHRVD